MATQSSIFLPGKSYGQRSLVVYKRVVHDLVTKQQQKLGLNVHFITTF